MILTKCILYSAIVALLALSNSNAQTNTNRLIAATNTAQPSVTTTNNVAAEEKTLAAPIPSKTNTFTNVAPSSRYEVQLRYWHADWSWDGENNQNDLGAGPFGQIGLAYQADGYDIAGYAGYGTGWAQDITRLDLSLGVNWRADSFSYGLGVRRMGFDGGMDGSSWSYLGPELMGGYETMLGGSDYSFQLNLAAGYYIWDFSQQSTKADGNTFGYAADVGLGYALRNATLRAGYRAQIVAEDAPFPQDEFMGPYVEIDFPL